MAQRRNTITPEQQAEIAAGAPPHSVLTTAQMDGADTLGPDTATIKDGAEAGPTPMGAIVAYDQTMAEITMARRLYDVWQTVGGLTDPKWDWERQSGKSHDAWLAVARAASPAVLAKHWKPASVADLLHG